MTKTKDNGTKGLLEYQNYELEIGDAVRERATQDMQQVEKVGGPKRARSVNSSKRVDGGLQKRRAKIHIPAFGC